jgi:predicted TIM-barrel fold metal-dependent hydrolase
MKILDPHLHLFDLQLGQYSWLKPENAPFWPDKAIINKSFSQQNLVVSGEYEIAGFVHIEAGFNNDTAKEEVIWLESVATKPFKTVAFIDVTLPVIEFERAVDELMQCQSVAGIRHILDDDGLDADGLGGALEILSLPQVKSNFIYLAKHHLSFDLQMPITETLAFNQLISILKHCPTLKVILNHAGWPPTADSAKSLAKSDWYSALKQLAALPQCAVKCSGWEMMDRQYDAVPTEKAGKATWQSQVLTLCLEAFGQERVMLASNFPLCLFHSSYQDYWDNVINILDNMPLTEPKKQALVFNNACSWYNLTV